MLRSPTDDRSTCRGQPLSLGREPPPSEGPVGGGPGYLHAPSPPGEGSRGYREHCGPAAPFPLRSHFRCNDFSSPVWSHSVCTTCGSIHGETRIIGTRTPSRSNVYSS